MKEVWKNIPEYEGFYQASSLGRIRSLDRYVNHPKKGVLLSRGKVLSQTISNNYYSVILSKEGVRKFKSVHKLVALSHLDNKSNFKYINHIDGNKLNNNKKNLEWCTSSHNNKHAVDTGLRRVRKGDEVNGAKLTENDVIEIKRLLEIGSLSQFEIGRLFGVSRGAIQGIKRGINWKHIK